MKIEGTARKISGSRYVHIPANVADWFFGSNGDAKEVLAVSLEDRMNGKKKQLIIEVV